MSASPDGNTPRPRTRDMEAAEPRQDGRDSGTGPGIARTRTTPPRVQPLTEGPLLLEGPADIVMPDGSVVHCDRPVLALCTCRRSLRAPFCDTSHRPRLRRGPRGTTARAPRPPAADADGAATDGADGPAAGAEEADGPAEEARTP
ncbi:CDGSH iron-sulfur domain-containing protein [Streptomyces sp. NPDC058326]|uniref:CDGSH iron-sulfur domain-containing protein n=1 Tax=Streptomyces sp. NPDC058326 TaxID=3346447 RepID=UPI0036E3B47B